jgi:hypothetical protein
MSRACSRAAGWGSLSGIGTATATGRIQLRYPALRCFHADTGQGLGAAHQTGWTGVVANLVTRRYRTDIPAYWRKTLAERARADAAA